MADVKIKHVPGRWRKTHDAGQFFYAEQLVGKHKGDIRMFSYMDVEKVYVRKRPQE